MDVGRDPERKSLKSSNPGGGGQGTRRGGFAEFPFQALSLLPASFGAASASAIVWHHEIFITLLHLRHEITLNASEYFILEAVEPSCCVGLTNRGGKQRYGSLLGCPKPGHGRGVSTSGHPLQIREQGVALPSALWQGLGVTVMPGWSPVPSHAWGLHETRGRGARDLLGQPWLGFPHMSFSALFPPSPVPKCLLFLFLPLTLSLSLVLTSVLLPLLTLSDQTSHLSNAL